MPRTRPRDENDVYRTVPLTGTQEWLERIAALNDLLPMELTTTDQFRAFIQGKLVAARIHEAESEDEMLLLYRVSVYGVKRGDFCIRNDEPTSPLAFLCLGNNGATTADWYDPRSVTFATLPSMQYVPTSGLDGDGHPTFFFTDEGAPLYVPKTFNDT